MLVVHAGDREPAGTRPSVSRQTSARLPKLLGRPPICRSSGRLAFGILPNVSTPLRHASSWNSNAQLLRRRRPEPRHRHRTAALSMVRPRLPRLHPQAHAQKCPRTMTHFSRFQARWSLLCASLRRHSPLRPADPIIFPSPFNKRSNHLRCPATTLIKSVATPHSALVSAKP